MPDELVLELLRTRLSRGDASDGFVLGSAMHPHTIEYQMVGSTVKMDEVVNDGGGGGSRYFQTDQPVVVGA